VVSPTLDDFRYEAKAFLDTNAQARSESGPFEWGVGSDDVSLFEELDDAEEAAALNRAKTWRALRYDAGLGWITGPKELGGRGLTREYERVYASLEARYMVPDTSFFGISLGMVAPTIQAHAQDAVKARYLPSLYRGDLIAAQLFSEPEAGSDLAGLQMRAVRDGDVWRLSGQKVWTSGAHYCDIGEVLCRTDPDASKHRGITALVVDLRAPGVEVRPLRQITGGAAFNEVYFDDVGVPDDHRLGEVNGGWSVALTTLMNERASIGSGSGGRGGGIGNGERLIEMLRHYGRNDDAVLRQDLARIYSGFQVAKWTSQRSMTRVRAGGVPGPEMAGSKLALTANMRAVSDLVSQVLGPRLIADTGEWGTYAWGKFLLGTSGLRIAGGTDEVLRKITAEQVLGLPKEPGVDTTSPFRDLPKS
jgi:acyl-CoA dehydrogenase